MSKKGKTYLSVFMMSALFFMMIDTQYVRPLGDYALSFFIFNGYSCQKYQRKYLGGIGD